MSKKQTTHTHKFLRSDARRLSSEVIEEIRNAQNNIPDAQRIMCKKHHIGSTTYQKIIDNKRLPEPTEKWRRIIESVSISDQISENNQESLHDTSSSTIIQEDRITHTEYPMDNENDANSNGLNTVTNGRKDKVNWKKKASIKLKDESSSADNKVANSFKDDTSRREFDLNKL
ncbi:996_t:CDS:1, partial [Rhizophagus irregularis]